MKIEYIPDGSKDCPLILIHGPDVNAIICLRQVCFNLTNGQAEFFVVHDLPGIEREVSCKLVAYAGRRDLGVFRMPEPDSFRWELTATSWLMSRDCSNLFADHNRNIGISTLTILRACS